MTQDPYEDEHANCTGCTRCEMVKDQRDIPKFDPYEAIGVDNVTTNVQTSGIGGGITNDVFTKQPENVTLTDPYQTKRQEKIILHLCADTGSDSKPYADAGYTVIKVGSDIGVENFMPPENVHGIIANPPCTEFSTARATGKARNPDDGMYLVEQCLRIIEQAKPVWWVIENPAKGVLKNYLGKPKYEYEPWWFGSPWTKRTALWGTFIPPTRKFEKWEDVPKIEGLYQRPGRGKPSLAFMHKNHKRFIREWDCFEVNSDMEFRSLCSQNFAKAFMEVNK